MRGTNNTNVSQRFKFSNLWCCAMAEAQALVDGWKNLPEIAVQETHYATSGIVIFSFLSTMPCALFV